MSVYSDDLREKIIKAYLERKDTKTNIAKRFDVDRKTVYRYVKHYEETGSMKRPPHRAGDRTKLNHFADLFLKRQVEKKPEITLEELRKKVFKKYGIDVTIVTISTHLKKMKYSRKKKLNMPNSKIH